MIQSENNFFGKGLIISLLLVALAGCGLRIGAAPVNYHDPEMDFSSLRTIAVMPFKNLTRDTLAGERVRDTLISNLLATGSLYAIPPGEVARGVARAGLADPVSPAKEEISKLAAILKADAFITGVVREYGEVRSGTTSSNVVSFSVQMIEAGTGKIVWTASSTKGGVSMGDRLLGGGGKPMNDVTEAAVNDVLNKLFK